MSGNAFKILSALALCTLSGTAWSNPPWPIPWSKQCTVEWPEKVSTEGAAAETFQAHDEDLQLAISERNGIRMLQVSRYNSDGQLTHGGYIILTPAQKTVKLYLNPILAGEIDRVLATIELHYESNSADCTVQIKRR